jgi:GH25 family lysozyme M1 (1,4-beta-N-acetylmuramidase)
MFIASSTAYDGEAMGAVKEWFGSIGKVVYPVGPLSLPESESDSLSKNGKSDSESHPVIEFLDRMQKKYGEKSVIYVSSMFFRLLYTATNTHL